MAIRLHKKRLSAVDNPIQTNGEGQVSGAKQIQRLIKPKIHLWLQTSCECLVCVEQKPVIKPQDDQVKEFKESSKKNHEWLKKILIGLTDKITKPLKLFVPDILFVVGDGLQIFSTNKKDYRISKFAGTTPVKAVFSTMSRLRKQYKGMLQQNFRKTMIDKINPKFMHVKYYDKLLPSHFHDGDGSKTLSLNKSKFKTYILHNNQKYIISSIQEHKMNQKQAFATLRYSQGNFQLLNQKQFQLFSIIKLPEDIVYIQSYIKSKQFQAIVISSYTQNNPKQQVDFYLWRKAQLYVMVLLGGLGKYDQGYDQLQNFQDQSDQLMKDNPHSYAKLITYQIVHFLSMAANIYIRHIKIKWIINDIDNVYLQEIIQFDTDDLSKRSIRYKQPPVSEIHNFYQDASFFVEVHRQMKKKREQNLIKVKKQLQQKTYEEILQGTKSSLSKKKLSVQKNDENPQKLNGSQVKSIFKRLNSSKRRTISNLDIDSLIHEQNKMSIATKDSISIQNSKNYSTINPRSSYNETKTKHGQSVRNSINNSPRRSISAFGGGNIITRYEHKIMESQRKRLNKSVNRYDQTKQQVRQKTPFGFHVTKGRRQHKTIDFS